MEGKRKRRNCTVYINLVVLAEGNIFHLHCQQGGNNAENQISCASVNQPVWDTNAHRKINSSGRVEAKLRPVLKYFMQIFCFYLFDFVRHYANFIFVADIILERRVHYRVAQWLMLLPNSKKALHPVAFWGLSVDVAHTCTQTAQVSSAALTALCSR